MSEAITAEFVRAIQALCQSHDQSQPGEELIGLGLMCGDAVAAFGPCRLNKSKVPVNAEAAYRFNPVDWEDVAGAEAFASLNSLLASRRVDLSSPTFPEHVREVFDAALAALARIELHKRYGPDLFVVIGGTDPSLLLEREEHRFVKLANSPTVYAAWLRDFAYSFEVLNSR